MHDLVRLMFFPDNTLFMHIPVWLFEIVISIQSIHTKNFVYILNKQQFKSGLCVRKMRMRIKWYDKLLFILLHVLGFIHVFWTMWNLHKNTHMWFTSKDKHKHAFYYFLTVESQQSLTVILYHNIFLMTSDGLILWNTSCL